MYFTNDVFDDLLSAKNWFDRYFYNYPEQARTAEYPYINLYENNDALEIKVVAPGVTSADLDIQLLDNTLFIEGNKKSDYMDKHYIRRERDFGKFKKSIKLPYRVDHNHIDASMKDGILTVKLVKSDEAKPKKIEIQ